MKYEIKIEGTQDPKGMIDLVRLSRLADSLHKIAEGALQIRLRGLSFSKGRKRSEIDNALSIYITGIREGSTCIDIESDTFGNTLKSLQSDNLKQEFQQNLFDLTPVSLIMSSYREAMKENPSTDKLDKPLLRELKNFKKVFINEEESINISNQGSNEPLTINYQTFNNIDVLEDELPNPQSVIINGTLELLKYSKQKVTIQTNEGMVDGFLSDSIDKELIGIYWGKEITLSGNVHFKPGGKSIFEIEKIFKPADGDTFFSKKSKTENIEQQIERQLQVHKNRNQLSDIIGKWPGDESFEDLLSLLTK